MEGISKILEGTKWLLRGGHRGRPGRAEEEGARAHTSRAEDAELARETMSFDTQWIRDLSEARRQLGRHGEGFRHVCGPASRWPQPNAAVCERGDGGGRPRAIVAQCPTGFDGRLGSGGGAWPLRRGSGRPPYLAHLKKWYNKGKS